jgi:RNA polymerase sigma factor (sigma-70 family)
MWAEMERSPALAAPGSNNCGNDGRSTGPVGGISEEINQALSDAQFDLVTSYLPLAWSLTKKYHGLGVSHDELRAGAEDGLIHAALKFDPGRGHFPSYARPCIKGSILSLFKQRKLDALNRSVSIETPIRGKDGEEAGTIGDLLVGQFTGPVAPDLSSLSETDRTIVQARESGETLREIGERLGISSERVRQREVKARSQIRGLVVVEFSDRPPPAHTYCEPKPSKEIARHRILAQRLADLRGNAPLRTNGPYGGPVIHAWGRP